MFHSIFDKKLLKTFMKVQDKRTKSQKENGLNKSHCKNAA